jgi:hypothetical protein
VPDIIPENLHPTLAVTPYGHLIFTGADDVSPLAADVAGRLRDAFARGAGGGLRSTSTAAAVRTINHSSTESEQQRHRQEMDRIRRAMADNRVR